jgi:OmpA-OmpF porin, OOP family
MKLNLLAGAAFAALLAATSVSAAESEGWYGAVDLGYNWKSEYGAKSTGNMPDGSPFAYNVATDDDWAGFARLGYRYTPNWRVELEGGYRPGDVTAALGFPRIYSTTPPSPTTLRDTALCTPGVVRTATTPCGGPNGNFDQTTVMANLIYDLVPSSSFSPFIGLGIGLNQVKADFTGQYSFSPNGVPQNVTISGKDTVAAYQALAGFAWALSDRLDMDFTYRYLETSEVNFDATSSTNFAPGSFSGKFNDQTVTVGLRWALGAAVPPPPPPPVEPAYVAPVAPPPPPVEAPPAAKYEAREFIVYFEFDKSFLTSDAQAIVQQAADYAKGGNATRIVVVGHADTSGSAAYNIRLSERRAKVVADALAGLGVAGSVLAVDWKGESAPAVATGDGVKEPLNRRSTIDIAF